MENLSENFIYKDKERVEAKLWKLADIGKDKVYLVSDFDRTITPALNEKGELVSTWDLLSRKLPPDIRAAELALYEKYRPLEITGKMTVNDAIEWWSMNLDLYEKSKLNWSDLELEVEEAIPARSGAKELFDVCQEKEIPTIIVSAGIKDVIELWCRKFEVRPEMILSTKLFFDAQGYVCGWDNDSLVYSLNKNAVGKKYFDNLRKMRPCAILIGDSMDDAATVDGTDDVLRFFVDDQPDKHMRNHDFYDKIFEKFDLIVKNGSLLPIVEIIKAVRQ